jgi:hypothetical protein
LDDSREHHREEHRLLQSPLHRGLFVRYLSNLGITSIYLQGIDNAEIIEAVQHDARRWSRSAPRDGFDGDAAPRAKRSRGDGVAHDRTYV